MARATYSKIAFVNTIHNYIGFGDGPKKEIERIGFASYLRQWKSPHTNEQANFGSSFFFNDVVTGIQKPRKNGASGIRFINMLSHNF